MKTDKHRFAGKHDYNLVGFLDKPDDEKFHAVALFAHCFTCNKHLKAVRNISLALTGEGIAVFRFDFTGLGESEGDFADTNFSSNIDDLVSAAEYLQSHDLVPTILIGHSLGGAAVLHAAQQLDSIKAVVTIAAPSEPAHVKYHFEESMDEINEKGFAHVQLAGRPFTIKKQFIDDLESTRIDNSIDSLNAALLILHSPADTTVGVDNAAKIFQTARHPKSFVSLDQADHLLNDQKDSQYVGNLIAAWSSLYLNE